MRTARKILVSILVSTIVILVILLPVGGTPAQDAQRARTNAQPDAVPAGGVVTVGEPVTPDLTIAFRDAPIAEVEFTLDREINPRMNYNSGVDPAFRLEGGPDPLLAFQDAALPSAVDPGFLTP
ncbi:MAG: hypothetical protein JW726_03350, partial [Anaerolineales bacterium]|nr:hypothetical protein [Anaerolineales bacterium]